MSAKNNKKLQYTWPRILDRNNESVDPVATETYTIKESTQDVNLDDRSKNDEEGGEKSSDERR